MGAWLPLLLLLKTSSLLNLLYVSSLEVDSFKRWQRDLCRLNRIYNQAGIIPCSCSCSEGPCRHCHICELPLWGPPRPCVFFRGMQSAPVKTDGSSVWTYLGFGILQKTPEDVKMSTSELALCGFCSHSGGCSTFPSFFNFSLAPSL